MSDKRINPLGLMLRSLLEQKGMTAAEFSRRVKVHHGTLTMIQKRAPTRLPNKVALDQWAKVLNLSAAEAALLKEAAELAYSPAGIQELVKRLRPKRG